MSLDIIHTPFSANWNGAEDGEFINTFMFKSFKEDLQMKKQHLLIVAGLIAGVLFFNPAHAQMMHGKEKKGEKPCMMQGGMMGGMMQGGMMGGMMGGMHGKMQGMHQGFGFYLNLAGKLNLTDAQKKQLRNLKFSYEKANIQREAALETAKLELKQLQAADPVDAKKVEAKIREVYNKEADIKVALFQAKQKAFAVLTDAQKAQVKSMTCPMCGQMHGGGMMQGMMGQGGMMKGMMQQGQQKQDDSSQHEQHHPNN